MIKNNIFTFIIVYGPNKINHSSPFGNLRNKKLFYFFPSKNKNCFHKHPLIVCRMQVQTHWLLEYCRNYHKFRFLNCSSPVRLDTLFKVSCTPIYPENLLIKI